jgi:DNA-binding transcriptional ArsR family regulator
VKGASLQAFKADFFRALAHPLRIRILETLGTGERTVQELQQILGLDQPIVSQQLAVLSVHSPECAWRYAELSSRQDKDVVCIRC